MDRPLATRMRPRNFKEFVGHHHLSTRQAAHEVIGRTSPPSSLLSFPHGKDHVESSGGGGLAPTSAAVAVSSASRTAARDGPFETHVPNVLSLTMSTGLERRSRDLLRHRGRLDPPDRATTENPYHSLFVRLSELPPPAARTAGPDEIRVLLELAVFVPNAAWRARCVATDDASITSSAGARVDHGSVTPSSRRPLADAGETGRRSDGGRRRPKRIVAYDRDNTSPCLGVHKTCGCDPTARVLAVGIILLERPPVHGATPGARLLDVGLADPLRCVAVAQAPTPSNTSACLRLASISPRRPYTSRGRPSRTR